MDVRRRQWTSIEIKIGQGARKMDPKCVKAPLN